MSSLWLSCLFPTGVQDYHRPSSGQPYHLHGWIYISPPASSPTWSRHTHLPWEMLGEKKKIINLNEGLATFLQVLAFFNHRCLWEEVFFNKETPKGGVSLCLR